MHRSGIVPRVTVRAPPSGRVRPRRLRRTRALREWVAEGRFDPKRLIYPVFVSADRAAGPIASMPGVERRPLSGVAALAETAADTGLSALLLFGLPRRKDEEGSEAYGRDAIVPEAVRRVKSAVPELIVLTDVCLCAYTDHGHCGIWNGTDVDNDRTLELLGRMANAHAAAGADIVAPSAMMDHQVAALRDALDAEGHTETAILSYAVKLASSFYGPFRDAADSAPAVGDRRSYQLDPRNAREAERELALDVAEGADLLMVKPALPALDLVRRARERSSLPLAAYQVSGEYSMIKAAAERGWLEESAAVDESLEAIHRAGADLIVSYFALDVARRRAGTREQ